MHKYNTLYTRTLSWHVLTPTSLHKYNNLKVSALQVSFAFADFVIEPCW